MYMYIYIYIYIYMYTCNGTGLSDPISPRLPPTPWPFKKQRPASHNMEQTNKTFYTVYVCFFLCTCTCTCTCICMRVCVYIYIYIHVVIGQNIFSEWRWECLARSPRSFTVFDVFTS